MVMLLVAYSYNQCDLDKRRKLHLKVSNKYMNISSLLNKLNCLLVFLEIERGVYPLKDQSAFIGNVAILDSSLRIEFLFIFFEVFTQHFLEEYL